MKIGCFVQGFVDEAVVDGFRRRWCPIAGLAPAKYRGESQESFRRELPKALYELREVKKCDFVVILTDSDVNNWREVKRREWGRVPSDYHHIAVFGVADRNIECWLRLDRRALADELGCPQADLDAIDPAGVVKGLIGRLSLDFNEQRHRIAEFVKKVGLREWLLDDSFEDFYKDVRAWRRGPAV